MFGQSSVSHHEPREFATSDLYAPMLNRTAVYLVRLKQVIVHIVASVKVIIVLTLATAMPSTDVAQHALQVSRPGYCY